MVNTRIHDLWNNFGRLSGNSLKDTRNFWGIFMFVISLFGCTGKLWLSIMALLENNEGHFQGVLVRPWTC